MRSAFWHCKEVGHIPVYIHREVRNDRAPPSVGGAGVAGPRWCGASRAPFASPRAGAPAPRRVPGGSRRRRSPCSPATPVSGAAASRPPCGRQKESNQKGKLGNKNNKQ